MADSILGLEGLDTSDGGYAVFYPNDGFLTRVSDIWSTRTHWENLLHLFPNSYIVRVQIERVP